MSIVTISAQATIMTELEEESEDLTKQLSEINSDILEITLELETIQSKIERTEAEILKTQDELVFSKEREEEQYENMKLRIRYMYEGGQESLLATLLGAESFKDFINRLEYITSITEYDRDMLGSLEDISASIKFEEENLIAQQKALLVLQENSTVVQESLAQKAEETSTDIEAVRQEISALKEAERIAAEKAEAERVAAEKAATEAAKAEAEKLAAQKAEEERLEAESNNTNANTSTESNTSTSTGNSDTNKDQDVLAAILDCEATSNYNAMLAVATVIMNRVSSSKFPNSITGVVYATGQFSPTWTGKMDRVLAQGASTLAYRVAKDAINGARLESVSHCYYFLYAGSTNRTGINVGGNLFFTSW